MTAIAQCGKLSLARDCTLPEPAPPDVDAVGLREDGLAVVVELPPPMPVPTVPEAVEDADAADLDDAAAADDAEADDTDAAEADDMEETTASR